MQLISKRPAAIARLKGNLPNAQIQGAVRFYQFPGAILVEAEVSGLPNNSSGFHGFHIHEGSACSGTNFSNTGEHFGALNAIHPKHAGDLPPLLSRNGRAYLAVMTDRFSITDVLGRTVVIHSDADDFKSQPAGNAGNKIACGAICKF